MLFGMPVGGPRGNVIMVEREKRLVRVTQKGAAVR